MEEGCRGEGGVISTDPERLVNKPELIAAWALLLMLAAIAWVFTLRDALHMGNMPGTMGLGILPFLIMWTLMMAAMMLPSLAPVTVLYLKALKATRGIGIPTVLALACGYLLVWALFGLLAYGAALAAGKMAMGHGISPWLGAGIIALCGLYQFTPFKQSCLNHCRSPVSFLLHFGNYRGMFRDVQVGFYHGGYCAGCCFSLMVIMVAVGVMNVAWMIGLAAVIYLEKVWRYGREFAYAVGVLLVIMSMFIPWNPWLLPGLYSSM